MSYHSGVHTCSYSHAYYVYSRASEQRTLWERASCPLLGGCPYLGGSTHFDCIILNKLVNALKCKIRAVEMIIKWLVCSVFSINIAQAEFFVSEVATPKPLSGFKANIIIAHAS